MTKARDLGGLLTSTGDIVSSALDNAQAFDAGTKMIFNQTSSPTGWTKDTVSNDDSALRVTTGTVGTGGSTGFATAMGTPSVSGTVGLSGDLAAGNLAVSISGNISDTTLTVSQMPSHTHNIIRARGYQNNLLNKLTTSNANTNDTNSTQPTGGSGAHNHAHSLSGSMTGAPGVGNLAGSLSSATTSINVKYVDVIVATKD